MKKYLTYLACPYTVKPIGPASFDPSFIRRLEKVRADAATKASCWLMLQKRWNVFSPITHSQPMHHIGGLFGDWEFWKKIDTEYLELSCRLVVLCIPGWKESTGVQAEIEIAKTLEIPIWYLTIEEGKYVLDVRAPEHRPVEFDSDLV